jgi:hypothetical protein
MVLLRSPAPAAPAPPLAGAVPSLGSLVIGAARSRTIDVAIPLFITAISAQSYGVGGSANGAPPGLPIFNLDGGLIGVSAGNGTAWRIRYVLDRLLPQTTGGSPPSSIGISFQAIAEPLATAMGTQGLAILDVVPGGAADAAGIQRGDVITAVGTESGADNADLAAALAALPAGTPASLSLRRGSRQSSVTVTPAFAHEMIGARLDPTPPTAPRARTLFNSNALAAASVSPDAVVLMIDGRAITSTVQGARDLRRAKAGAVALVDDHGRRFFAVIDTGR